MLFSLVALATPRVAIVPGCPSEEDGTVSACQWRRALWAARTWEGGEADLFVTSGSDVYNPFVEADALALALEALGVPGERILRERNALHTDQNVAWSLDLIEPLAPSSVLVVSDTGHAGSGCAMVRAWSTLPCSAPKADYRYAYDRIRAGLPELRLAPTAAWEPLEQREARIAAATGAPPRPPSFWVYLGQALAPKKAARPVLPAVALNRE